MFFFSAIGRKTEYLHTLFTKLNYTASFEILETCTFSTSKINFIKSTILNLIDEINNSFQTTKAYKKSLIKICSVTKLNDIKIQYPLNFMH